jgi:hypothetical protein
MKTKKTKYFTEGLQTEAFQFILKPSDWPNPVRLTYSKPKGGVLLSIEELDASESVICNCKFRGRTAQCSEGGEWIKDDKPFFNSFKVQDWCLTDIFVEQYFQKH